MKGRISSIGKWFLVVVVCLSLLYAVLLVAATLKLRRAYAALEGDGRPMHRADILPEALADWDNAAGQYQIAFLRLKSASVGGEGREPVAGLGRDHDTRAAASDHGAELLQHQRGTVQVDPQDHLW